MSPTDAAPARSEASTRPPVELGTIEGFYGRPWSWEERRETVRFLAPRGYRSYLYAPKADALLRRRWTEPRPPEARRELTAFGRACAAEGVRFGIGLSPYEAWLDFDGATRDALARKLDAFETMGAVDVALLFDDMRGDLPDLAERQIEIVEWARERGSAERWFVCPSYYSDDPVLDRVFGDRPEGYLASLGAGLHPTVEVFWTGPEVVSRQISPGHVRRVAAALGRKPFLWDNYPVNDGQRMCEFLHLRGFSGRPAGLAAEVAGHGVNPALQPTLTRIPMATLPESYALGEEYDYAAAFRRAAREVMGPELGDRLREDLLVLQDLGRHRLDAEKESALRARWEGLDHPGARELVAWLDGAWAITDEIVHTQ